MTVSHSFCRVAQNDQQSLLTIGHFALLTLGGFCIIINIRSTIVNLCMVGIRNLYFNKEGRVKMGKLDTNKKVKEDSLLNTAFSLFTTKGVSKTSISDIVNNAGVAKGTFYLYFKDKYDIRNKLVSHKSSQLFRNAIEALNASGKKLTFNERIIFIVDNIINQLNENKSLLTFIAKNLIGFSFFFILKLIALSL